MSISVTNKILVVKNGHIIHARQRPWTSADGRMLIWYSRRHYGSMPLDEEGRTWIRGWQHDKQELDALWTAAALSR